ncbi:YggT family protein [uncultured Methylobacterium sp.]|uniref:YggT family protein n=1 Tax=uncultured Methylobacterium sp. TaxID=157278 RepID=UPI0035CAC331
MNSLIWLFDTIVQLFIYVLIASAVLSWLVAFNVVNVRNPIVAQIGEVLYRITEPVLRPIRNLLPNLGGVDISPIILILLLLFVSRLLHEFVPADPYVYAR